MAQSKFTKAIHKSRFSDCSASDIYHAILKNSYHSGIPNTEIYGGLKYDFYKKYKKDDKGCLSYFCYFKCLFLVGREILNKVIDEGAEIVFPKGFGKMFVASADYHDKEKWLWEDLEGVSIDKRGSYNYKYSIIWTGGEGLLLSMYYIEYIDRAIINSRIYNNVKNSFERIYVKSEEAMRDYYSYYTFMIEGMSTMMKHLRKRKWRLKKNLRV